MSGRAERGPVRRTASGMGRLWHHLPWGHPDAPLSAGQSGLLFTPGPRLGWVFRDRRELAAPCPGPEPSPQAIQAQAAARMAAAGQAWQRAWRWAGKPSIALALVLVALAGYAKSASGCFNLGLTAGRSRAATGSHLAGWHSLYPDVAVRVVQRGEPSRVSHFRGRSNTPNELTDPPT